MYQLYKDRKLRKYKVSVSDNINEDIVYEWETIILYSKVLTRWLILWLTSFNSFDYDARHSKLRSTGITNLSHCPPSDKIDILLSKTL